MPDKTDVARCELCGEPMPPGEEMFKLHGYSGPCPKFAVPTAPAQYPDEWARAIHYPECWDTAAYPTLRHAIHEVVTCAGCSEHLTQPVGAERDGLQEALKDATLHLISAASAYGAFAGKLGRKSVQDALYHTRMEDFKAAIERACAALGRES